MVDISERVAPPQLGLRTSRRGDWVVMGVAGEVDTLTSPELKRAIQSLTGHNGLKLILDLTDVTFFDSSGLSAVVAALKMLRQEEGQLRLVTDSRRISKVFEIAGLDRIIGVYPSVGDALAV